MAHTNAMLMVGATGKHRDPSERANARANLHLVAAEFNHEPGIDRRTLWVLVQPSRAAEVIVNIHPKGDAVVIRMGSR